MKAPKVIDSPWTFFVAVAVVGPFALPLLWRNPNLSKKIKWLGSVIVILFTFLLFFFAERVLQALMDRLQMPPLE